MYSSLYVFNLMHFSRFSESSTPLPTVVMVLSPNFLIFYVLQHASYCVLLPVSFLNLYIAIYSFRHLILRANVERIVFILENLTFRGPCIVIYSYNKSQRDALFLKFILIKNSTCFRQICCPSTEVSMLYTQQQLFVMLVMSTVC
jgi:hypothetical protein